MLNEAPLEMAGFFNFPPVTHKFLVHSIFTHCCHNVNFIFPTTEITTLNIMIGFSAPTTGRIIQLEWPKEVRCLFEIFTDGKNFMNQVFHADDVTVTQLFLNKQVLRKRCSPVIDLTITTFLTLALRSVCLTLRAFNSAFLFRFFKIPSGTRGNFFPSTVIGSPSFFSSPSFLTSFFVRFATTSLLSLAGRLTATDFFVAVPLVAFLGPAVFFSAPFKGLDLGFVAAFPSGFGFAFSLSPAFPWALSTGFFAAGLGLAASDLVTFTAGLGLAASDLVAFAAGLGLAASDLVTFAAGLGFAASVFVAFAAGFGFAESDFAGFGFASADFAGLAVFAGSLL
uniref:Uncharacterized protein n=1 Tax=Strigamia maritima TaxID=126957 RepID=T1JD25_STRMM